MAKSLLILLCAALASASPQDADATKSPDIFGRVVNSETRGPVRRAALKVFNASGQWDTITDGEGRFRFRGLVPADYNLVVHRDGYTDHAYIVEKSDFSKQEELPVELRPQGLLTGRVAAGSGQVLQSALIEAMAQKTRGGMFEVVASVRTNDLGEYRLAGLDPRVYQVRATYRGGRFDELDPTPLTMATAYYGGSGTPTQLAVKAGGVTTGVDFVLSPVRPATVRGTLRTEAGPLSEPATIWIMGREGQGGHNDTGIDGRFEIADVGQGTYTISAETLNQATPLFGVSTVEVHADDVDGVDLVLRPVPKIDAEIRVEGGGVPDVDLGSVYLLGTEPVKGTNMVIGHPGKDGRFTVALIPSEYSLSFDQGIIARVVKEVTLNGVPVINWKFRVDQSPDAKKLVIVVGAKRQ